MGYYELTKSTKELNVVYKISEDDIVYILYSTTIDKDGTPNTDIIKCYRDEDKVIDKIEHYPVRQQYSEYNYRTVIIEPKLMNGNVIYNFYIVIFNDINSSKPNDIKVVSYLCDNRPEPKDYTTKFTELIGVYEEDDMIIVRMMDVAVVDNTRMNRNEIITEAKELRKQYLMKKFDI